MASERREEEIEITTSAEIDDQDTENAFLLAAQNGNLLLLDGIKKIFSKIGLNPKNIKDSDFGGNALHWASFNGHLDIVESLLQSYPDLLNSQTKNGSTPLFNAIDQKHFKIVKYLIEKGADLSIKTNSGETPTIAAQSSSQKIKDYINSLAIKPNSNQKKDSTSNIISCLSQQPTINNVSLDEQLDALKKNLVALLSAINCCQNALNSDVFSNPIKMKFKEELEAFKKQFEVLVLLYNFSSKDPSESFLAQLMNLNQACSKWYPMFEEIIKLLPYQEAYKQLIPNLSLLIVENSESIRLLQNITEYKPSRKVSNPASEKSIEENSKLSIPTIIFEQTKKNSLAAKLIHQLTVLQESLTNMDVKIKKCVIYIQNAGLKSLLNKYKNHIDNSIQKLKINFDNKDILDSNLLKVILAISKNLKSVSETARTELSNIPKHNYDLRDFTTSLGYIPGHCSQMIESIKNLKITTEDETKLRDQLYTSPNLGKF